MIREMNTWYNEQIHFFLIQFDINFVLNGDKSSEDESDIQNPHCNANQETYSFT